MKILIATDGSEFSASAIDEVCRKIFKPRDEIRIAAVVEPLTHIVGAPFGVVDEYYHELMSEARNQATEFLKQGEAHVRRAFPNANLSIEILTGAPAQAIVEKAEKWGADVIAVGSHGRGFWARTMLGSVSSGVVSHAPCSVLVVRKPE